MSSKYSRHIGVKFNRLTVKSMAPSKHGTSYFLCICDCGREKEIRATHVASGASRSCGCVVKEGLSHRKAPGHAGLTSVIIGYKKNAEKRGLVFNLTRSEFQFLAIQNCNYCNIGPSNICAPYASSYISSELGREARKLASFSYNGIDRVDNDIGYTIENTVPCCKVCNFAKRNMSLKDFLIWISNVANNLRSKNVID